MNRPTHPELVHSLAKPGLHVLESLTPHKCDLMHAAFGINTEAGELSDALKRVVFYNKPIDRANIIEELGDLEFYMELLRDRLGISREETLEGNIDKLMTRYAEGYSDAAAQQRADKQPPRNVVAQATRSYEGRGDGTNRSYEGHGSCDHQ